MTNDSSTSVNDKSAVFGMKCEEKEAGETPSSSSLMIGKGVKNGEGVLALGNDEGVDAVSEAKRLTHWCGIGRMARVSKSTSCT